MEFSETEKYANFTWKNEGLEEGTFDFRVFAEDQSENVSEEYVCSYRYSRDGDNEAQVPRVELPSNYSLRVGKDYECP